MFRIGLLALGAILLSGCSNQQASQLGMRGSPVTAYPQNMTNMQLCETLYYKRPTTQTKVAIGAEFNKRRLNKLWCDNEYKKWYIESAVEALASSTE